MPTEQCWGSSEGSFLAPPGEIVWWSHSKWLFSCYLFILLHQPLLHPHDYPIPLFTSSVQLLSCVLQPHGLQHTRPPCPSPTPGVYSDTRASSWWCHPTISSSVIPFSCHLWSFPALGSFLMSQLVASGGQSIGVSASASVPPMNRALQRCLKPWLLNALKMTGMKRSWFITLKIDKEKQSNICFFVNCPTW